MDLDDCVGIPVVTSVKPTGVDGSKKFGIKTRRLENGIELVTDLWPVADNPDPIDEVDENEHSETHSGLSHTGEEIGRTVDTSAERISENKNMDMEHDSPVLNKFAENDELANDELRWQFEDYLLALVKSAIKVDLSPTDRTSLNKIDHNPRHNNAWMKLRQKINSERIQEYCRLYCGLEISIEETFEGFKMDCMCCGALKKGSVLAVFRDPLYFNVEEGARVAHSTDDIIPQIQACFLCSECVDPLADLHFLSQLRWTLFDVCAKKIAIVKAKRVDNSHSPTFASEIMSISGWWEGSFDKLLNVWSKWE